MALELVVIATLEVAYKTKSYIRLPSLTHILKINGVPSASRAHFRR